jgi:hypothetical protein
MNYPKRVTTEKLFLTQELNKFIAISRVEGKTKLHSVSVPITTIFF